MPIPVQTPSCLNCNARVLYDVRYLAGIPSVPVVVVGVRQRPELGHLDVYRYRISRYKNRPLPRSLYPSDTVIHRWIPRQLQSTGK